MRVWQALLAAAATAAPCRAQTTSTSYPPQGSGWTLVFRHSAAGGQYWPRDQWRVNANSLSSPLYSVMDALENFRQPDGSFVLKIEFPGLCSRYSGACAVRSGRPVTWLTWSQTSDPFRTRPAVVTGFTPIDVDPSLALSSGSLAFNGLARNGGPCLMDGQHPVDNWWYAAGTHQPYGGARNFPGPHGSPRALVVSTMEIYAWGRPQYTVNSPLWRLVFRQSAADGFQPWTRGAATNATSSDLAASTPATAPLYSALSTLDVLFHSHVAAGVSPPLAFKVRYPGLCSFSGTRCDGGRDYVIFSQNWNPLSPTLPASPTVALLDVGAYSGGSPAAGTATLAGLQRSASGSALGARLLLGASSTFAYDVGVARAPAACANCLPGPMVGGTTLFGPTVELYVHTGFTVPQGGCDLSSNYYSINTNSQVVTCAPLSNCTLGSTYETAAPTRVSDRACSPVSQCWTSATDMSGMYVVSPATLEDDVQCAPLSPQCSTLPTPHYESAPATPTSDRVCAAQPVCLAPFTYEALGPTATTARVCLPTTACGDDLVQQAAPTPTTDRVCAGCPAGQYVVNGLCVPAGTCAAGSTFATVPPMGDDNTVCSAVSTCRAWEYTLAPATPTNDAVCVTATNCTGLTSVALQGTMTTPATCQPRCPPCGANEAAQAPAGGGSAGTGCTACSTLTPPSIGTSGQRAPAITAQGGTVSIVADEVNVQGVGLIAWNRALQLRLQASESAVVAMAADSDRTRTALEATVGQLRSQVAQLQATVAALVAEHRGG